MSVPTNTTGQAAATAARRQEAVMGKAIPSQHPAVVLRSHYLAVRALLAIAMIAVVGLTAALVIVANDDDTATTSASPTGQINYGGFNPATGRPDSAPLAQQEHPLRSRIGTTRYDSGPEEGTRGVPSAGSEARPSAGVRFDGGPEEGTRGPGR